jgi:hypothetical protein
MLQHYMYCQAVPTCMLRCANTTSECDVSQDAALCDEYFTSRRLYPNVDYYRCVKHTAGACNVSINLHNSP